MFSRSLSTLAGFVTLFAAALRLTAPEAQTLSYLNFMGHPVPVDTVMHAVL